MSRMRWIIVGAAGLLALAWLNDWHDLRLSPKPPPEATTTVVGLESLRAFGAYARNAQCKREVPFAQIKSFRVVDRTEMQFFELRTPAWQKLAQSLGRPTLKWQIAFDDTAQQNTGGLLANMWLQACQETCVATSVGPHSIVTANHCVEDLPGGRVVLMHQPDPNQPPTSLQSMPCRQASSRPGLFAKVELLDVAICDFTETLPQDDGYEILNYNNLSAGQKIMVAYLMGDKQQCSDEFVPVLQISMLEMTVNPSIPIGIAALYKPDTGKSPLCDGHSGSPIMVLNSEGPREIVGVMFKAIGSEVQDYAIKGTALMVTSPDSLSDKGTVQLCSDPKGTFASCQSKP